MNKQPLVSILMPVKNTELFLVECLNSILLQTYQNWELIAVDDNSTDESYQLLSKYAETDTRINVFSNKQQGIIAALQLAYQHAKGEFITRMDSDDLMEPTKLFLMVEQLQEKGKGYLAVGLVTYFSANKLGDGYLKYANWLNRLTLTASNFDEIYKECSIPSPCWMIYRNDFDACGGFNSEVYPEDYELAFRFRKGGLKIAPVPDVIHQWRDYEMRTSRTDANYADNRFAELKVMHFLDQDYHIETPLVLWGAGKKGKLLAKLLTQQEVEFYWVCNNQNKIGKNIYGIVLGGLQMMNGLENAQIIVAVSSPDDLQQIDRLIEGSIQQLYYRFF